MFQPTEQVRYSGRDAGIQLQGCETMSDTAPYNALALSAQTIHAAMTVLAEASC